MLESELTESNSLSEDFEEKFYAFNKECLYRYSESSVLKKALSDSSKMLDKTTLAEERYESSEYGDDQFISPTISIVATIDQNVTPVATLSADSSYPFKRLVKVMMGIFVSKETNPHGATLIFTTHYPEILDSVHRKDNTYFFVRAMTERLLLSNTLPA